MQANFLFTQKEKCRVWNNDCQKAFDKIIRYFAEPVIDNAYYTRKTLDPIFDNDRNNHGCMCGIVR